MPQVVAGLDIRPFAAADRAGLLTMLQRCALYDSEVERSIDFALGRDHTALLVGTAGAGPIASVLVGHDGHRGFLYAVAVDPDHRGKGWGRAMVAAAESWLISQGIWRAMLMVREDNKIVLGFYAAIGWGAVPHVVMQKRLTD